MSDERPYKVHIIRKDQHLYDQEVDGISADFKKLGSQKLDLLQYLSLHDHWPITIGSAVAACGSGFVGVLINRQIVKNLSLKLVTRQGPTMASCFIVPVLAHIALYYSLVLRDIAGDPNACSTCLEIRTLSLSLIAPTMATSVSLLANISASLLHKSIRLPPLQLSAYNEWINFLKKYPLRNLSRIFIYGSVFNMVLSSSILYGQQYYWKNTIERKIVEERLITRKRVVKKSLYTKFKDVVNSWIK
ncbi:unnamed protein product [Didymodactylos carnosus]|uniref:Uncharacterized protein n=1 Tax=Didymodactylos carnosus TaxID=1234261 RepID=A0A813YRB4_9BILA|nr:unnamed protein product [Didymodactylos carnosus]CAF1148614.1 unnamed protein product [Didymodactylos carnosus]CAF3672702.1 unnamed protein product [Didymodactylos carnosus]CAF3952863.1 unnamed protein product [Didymodactylos carnosus]